MKSQKSSSYCRDLVRMHDPDRFLLSLFAPADRRRALWVLFAFHYEIAKTREVVSETQLGLIRLQWWREEIGKLYDTGAAPDHEVLQALLEVIQEYDLPRDDFEALIYGREFDLEGVLPATVEGTLKYIESTNVPLMRLVMRVLGVVDEGVCLQIAMNYGLIGTLRAVPFHALQDRCYLPEDALRDCGANEFSLYKGKEVAAIIPVVRVLAGHFEGVKAHHRFLRAVQGLSLLYLNHLKDNGFDVFAAANARPPSFKEIRLYFSSLF